MANESKIANTIVNNIIEDAYFLAEDNTLMASLVTNMSDTSMNPRKVSAYAQSTAATVAEGAGVAANTVFSNSVQATLTPSKAQIDYVITDERVMSDSQNTMRDASMNLGLGIARKVDADLVDEFANFTIALGAAAGTPSISLFAATAAQVQNASSRMPRYVVLHPYHWHDVWTELGQPATNSFLGDAANQALRDYYTGTFLSMNWFVNSNITVDINDDAVSGVFSEGALALDVRRSMNVEQQREADIQSTRLVATMMYAVGVIYDDLGGSVTGDASAPTS